MAIKTVTINCDMGEAFGIYRLCDEERIMPLVTHVNVACGFHASDPTHMWKTVKLAKAFNVCVGAHPGLPDKEGFGRREIAMSYEEISAAVFYQVGALQAFLKAEGIVMSHLKPHGALMGMAQKQESTAKAIADVAQCFELPVIAVKDCILTDILRDRKLPVVCEFYADLDYDDAGNQVISRHHDAVSAEDARDKVLRALDLGVTRSISGRDVGVVADSVCVHGDTPGAVEVANAVFNAVLPRLRRTLVS
jgi:UPF0271 protein